MSSTTEHGPTPRYDRVILGMRSAASQAIDIHQALANPGELFALLSLLDAAEPVRVLEIGTYAAGSAWAFAQLRTVHQIVTVDEAPRPEAADRLASLPCKTLQITGRSGDPATIHQVTEALDGLRPDLVFIDGSHLYDDARRDFDLYGAMCETGGLVVLHDTQGYPGNDTVQVPKLWGELRLTYRTTEFIDVAGGPGGTGIVWF